MADDAREQLAAIARRWVEEGWCAGDGSRPAGSIVDELHAPDFIDYDSGGRASDNAGFRDGIVRLLAAFPDLEAAARDVVAEPAATCAGARGVAASGSIAVRWTAVGTHRGAYLGVEPTGKRIAFKGIEMIRVRNGRITERWGEWDGLELLGQLGRGL
ncbi:MAG: ester cyclase [bacterium]|nr:ester cyclase [bacterium]MBK7670387.1 ester cyclase [bacterium]